MTTADFKRVVKNCVDKHNREKGTEITIRYKKNADMFYVFNRHNVYGYVTNGTTYKVYLKQGRGYKMTELKNILDAMDKMLSGIEKNLLFERIIQEDLKNEIGL